VRHPSAGLRAGLVDTTGQIETDYAYDPFGVPLVEGEAYNPYQYTGEAWDAEVELLYLRARYYQPEVGRFVTLDRVPGEPERPSTLNHYLYVVDNPVNRVDPSGLEGPDPHGTSDGEWRQPPTPTPLAVPPGYPSHFVDHRDLTIWLAEELRWNAFEAVVTMRPFRDTTYPGCRSLWVALWLRRVADDHTWDFKDQIESKLGEAVMLRGTGDGYAWYEYSLPGNINFGYAGRAAGFPGLALHVGASFAEITDRAHKESGEAACLIPGIPDVACASLLQVYLNPEWQSTLYDNPEDWQSVEFGVQLWEQHPVGLTLDDFRMFLSAHAGMLAGSVHRAPSDAGEYHPSGNPWPYWRGYFNGPRTDVLPL
jgi:RHS repeat-associated protein